MRRRSALLKLYYGGSKEERTPLLPSSSLLFDFPKLIDSERSVGRSVPPRPEFCRIGEKRERGRKRRGESCKLPVFEDSPNKMRTSRLQGSEVRFYFRRTFKKLKIYRKQNLAKFLIAVDPSPFFRLPFNSPSSPPPPPVPTQSRQKIKAVSLGRRTAARSCTAARTDLSLPAQPSLAGVLCSTGN